MLITEIKQQRPKNNILFWHIHIQHNIDADWKKWAKNQ